MMLEESAWRVEGRRQVPSREQRMTCEKQGKKPRPVNRSRNDARQGMEMDAEEETSRREAMGMVVVMLCYDGRGEGLCGEAGALRCSCQMSPGDGRVKVTD